MRAAGMVIASVIAPRTTKRNNVDIFDSLKQDHDRVLELLRGIESSSGDERAQLFEEMQTELTLHSDAEDAVVYAEFAGHDALCDMVLEAREEHELISELLDDMGTMDSADEQWGAKLTVLIELVSHHVKEEESCLFTKAREVVDADFGEELAQRFEEEKESLRMEV